MAWKTDSPSYGFSPPPRRATAMPPTLRCARKSATHCVGCGKPLDARHRFCPFCQTERAQIRHTEALVFHCGSCQNVVEREWKCCPMCGMTLSPCETPASCGCGTILETAHAHCGGCGAPSK